MTTTDVVSVEENPALREMVRALQNQTMLDSGSTGNDFVLDLMESILSANDESEVFDLQESGMMAGKDFANRPFMLKADGIQWKQASASFIADGAFPFYAIIRATEIATGEEVTFNCGGKTFVASLYALQYNHDAFNEETYPEGRALVIIAKPSPAGAYLILRPVRQPEAPAARKRGK